jgi:hypothetical protein
VVVGVGEVGNRMGGYQMRGHRRVSESTQREVDKPTEV